MVSRFRRRNVIAIRQALDAHNSTCPEPARAVLLNPIDHGLMRFDDLWGVPILPDASVPVKRARIDCAELAENVEQDLEQVVDDALEARSEDGRAARDDRAA